MPNPDVSQFVRWLRRERPSPNKHIARLERAGSRLAVDADGCVWWVHADGSHSMVRTNPDNNPTPLPLTFYERKS